MSIADRTPRNVRNAIAAAAKADASIDTKPAVTTGNTALASGTVPTPNTAKPASAGDNVNRPASERALNMADRAFVELDKADTILSGGQQLLSAAIVDYCLNTVKYSLADMLAIARDDVKHSKTTLWAKFKQDMGRVFVYRDGAGAVPKLGSKPTLIEQDAHKMAMDAYAARYKACGDASELAVCAIVNGAVMADFNGALWNFRAPMYLPADMSLADPKTAKTRYTMERNQYIATIAHVPVGDKTVDKPARVSRDRAAFVRMVSHKFKLWDHAPKADTAQPGEQRAPHHNDTAPKPDATPGNTPASTTGSVGNLPAVPTTGMVPVPPSGLAPIVPDASATANPDVDRRNNPADVAAASHTLAANCNIIRTTLRQSLGVTNLRQVTAKPAKEIADKIGPHTLENDAWQTIEEIGIMWATLVGIKLPAEYLASVAKAQTETKMGNATLSTPIPPASVRNAKPVEVRRAPRKAAKGRKRAA